MKIILSILFQKYKINNYIFNIVLCKLYYKEEFCLIILLLFDKNLKINLYYAIFLFILTIYQK